MAIEREKILDAAMALLNDVGLDQMSTRKLAERLGVQQPALYWHFKSKSALLDALNEAMLERHHKHPVPAANETWDQFAANNARSFRDAMLAVRDGARINAGTRPQASQFADAEKQLQLYVSAGFSGEEAFNISIALARYVVGFVLEEQDERERTEEDGRGSDADPLGEVADYPILREVLKPLLDGGSINTNGVFEGGLAYLIDGARQSLSRKRK